MERNQEVKTLYAFQHQAVNYPLQFLSGLDDKKAYRETPGKEQLEFVKARALIISGNYRSGTQIMEKLGPALAAKADYFLAAKCYINLHSIYVFAGWDAKKSEDFLAKAEKHASYCKCKAVKAELKIIKALNTEAGQPLLPQEELLQEAMQDALEDDIEEVKLDIYIGFAMLYLKHLLPEMANRELTMIRNLISWEKHPYFCVQVENLTGIMYQILRDFDHSAGHLERAASETRARGYKHQLIPILINLGIYNTINKNIDEGIKLYRECLDLVQEIGIENSQNAYKVQDNLARALGLSKRHDEAIALMQTGIALCQQTGNQIREAMLHVNIANVLIEAEQFDEAKTHTEKGIEFYQKQQNQHYLIFAYRTGARLYEAMENFQEAFNIMELLDQTHQRHFQDNFKKQSEKYQQYIHKLEQDYLRIKSNCSSTGTPVMDRRDVELIGDHPTIRKALTDAMRAARYPFINVFITGESGTGKEVIARIIHAESKTGKNLVAVNASAISPNLIESELFGHKRGAFTGAISDKKGKFLLANKGTLLLDEISEMPIELQSKLLRAIETSTIQPVGSDLDVTIQCRIISTSNQKISDLIKENKFRLDLFHRLNKLEIHLLPLRERISDLEMLTRHFAKRFANDFGITEPIITDEFIRCLSQYSFPGNVRELINIVERIFILKPKPIWGAEQLEGLIDLQSKSGNEQEAFFRTGNLHTERGSNGVNINKNLKNAEYQMILAALEACNWVQKEAAQKLGMTESTISRRIKSLGISR